MSKNDCFDYKGVRYYAGTKFKMKIKYDEIVEAVFVERNDCNAGKIMVRYKSKYNKCIYSIYINKADLDNIILEICDGNYYDELEAKKHYRKDSEVPIVKMGWIMYIFIMCLLVIFKDAWMGWIAATWFFFTWRHKKLKEEYYYD